MAKIRIQTPDASLVTAYTVSDPIQAELIKNTLLDHGIQCELGGGHQAGFTGALAVEIIVHEPDFSRAIEIIKEHHLE